MPFSALKKIVIGEEVIQLYMDGQIPFAEYRNQTIGHLWILCRQCNCLTNPSHIYQFAEIANFFWKGNHFRLIEDIKEYQKQYLHQIECEKTTSLDVFPYRLTDYKIFDVSGMHEPQLLGTNLHFFVLNCATRLPYRVVCPFPYTATSTLVHYQVLPLMEETKKQDS